MSHHYLNIKDIHYTYQDKRKAINGINFEIIHGESVGLIGANGAGKSTILNLIVGLLELDSGYIDIGGKKVSKKTLSYIRQSVGLVFQETDSQLFMSKVCDDVSFGPKNYKLSTEEIKLRVNNALNEVGIIHLKDRKTYKLSGGEKRLVSIATVLSMLPDILLMDEPSANLDPQSRRNLIKLLKNFNHTKLIASHDLDMIMETCERVILLKNGKIIADGKTRELLKNKKLLEDNGLELPLSLMNCPICNSDN